MSDITIPPPNVVLHPEEVKQWLLTDLFNYLPETGIFDGADNKRHSLISTTLLSLPIETLEELLQLAESDTEAFEYALYKHLGNNASTRQKINKIVWEILLDQEEI